MSLLAVAAAFRIANQMTMEMAIHVRALFERFWNPSGAPF
jgi:hypothetical protein